MFLARLTADDQASPGAQERDIAMILQGPSSPQTAQTPQDRERLGFQTLIDAFKHAASAPQPQPLHLWTRQGTQERRSWAQLMESSLRVGAALEAQGLKPGERVLLIMPTSFELLSSLFGAMLIGATPLILAPPRAGQADATRFMESLHKLAARMQVSCALYDQSLAPQLRPTRAPGSPWRRALELEPTLEAVAVGATAWPRVTLPDLAYIQLTSGATGPIKGVALSHANVLSNVRAIGQRVHIQPDDVGVSWLPLDNIMGLVGFVFFSAYWGLELVKLDAERFLTHPHEWLRAIHQHRGTITAAPDFAYYHTLRRANERDLAQLDLSSLRVAMSGAEPVRARHMKLFLRRFGPYGLRERVFLPVYGLSEATLAVTFGQGPGQIELDAINRAALERRGEVEPLAPAGQRAPEERMHLVSVGAPLPDVQLQIMDPQGHPVEEGVLGEIVVRGPHVASGYVSPDELKQWPGGWLRTGDLGYIARQQLFVLERLQDVIWLPQGRRTFPNEIELFVNSIDGVRAGSAVAFAGERPGSLVVACETQAVVSLDELTAMVRHQLRHHLALEGYELLTLSAHSVPRTRDGKVCRGLARKLYLAGKLERRDRRGDLDPLVRLVHRARSDARRITNQLSARLSRLRRPLA